MKNWQRMEVRKRTLAHAYARIFTPSFKQFECAVRGVEKSSLSSTLQWILVEQIFGARIFEVPACPVLT